MKSFIAILSFLLICFLVASGVKACTVFVLTDGKHTYLFNNEDSNNPQTRLWFIPKGKGFYGCAYVGYNDGEAQGGINTEGLAFDWVTVEEDSYPTDPTYVPESHLTRLPDNSSQWMLERCKTVAEAIQFYKTYREAAFAKTTLVVADKSGASVVIGSKDGKIYFNTTLVTRGLGYGEATFQKLYGTQKAITMNNGAQILRQCLAPGEGGTKYSNAYNLTKGEIVFYQFAQAIQTTSLNLVKELAKGSHYYETPTLAQQIQRPALPLALNMNRHITSIYQPLTNQETLVTAKVQHLFKDVTLGKLAYDDLSAHLATDLKKDSMNVKSVMERLGKLNSLELIHKAQNQDLTDYSYIMKFDKVTILWQFLFDKEDKISDFNNLSVSWIR
ncbi:hypothetical protein [Spirosoma endbachense]|uniref:Uncharacterized protein n=1 Tax=Spirosoma endbachense TaxID=2666025 RepID=A0A6P1VUM4_9BACT|nr:hypothetical protein [Spirosoma endbachense]QHV95329.1 hypothetical protein GJR95_10030 [Spirosoma endbachense]